MILSRYYEKIINYGLLMTLIFSSFLGWETRYSYGWGVVVVVVLLLLVISFFDRQQKNKYPLSLSILGLTLGLAIFFANDKYAAITGFLPYLGAGIIFYLSYNYFNLEKLLIWVASGVGLIVGGYGLGVFFFQRNWSLGLGANFGWKNVLANFLLLIIFPVLVSFFQADIKLKKLMYGVISSLVLACLIVTISKTAWLIGLVGLMAWLLVAEKNKKQFLINLFSVFCLSLVMLTGVFCGQQYTASAVQGPTFQSISQSVVSFSYRIDYWIGAAKILLNNPVFGIGFNNFGFEYPKYQSALWTGTTDPHNFIINIFMAGGVVAGIAGLYFIWELLQVSWLVVKRKDILQMGLLWGVIASLLHSLFDLGWTVPAILFWALFLLGVLFKQSGYEFVVWTWRKKLVKIFSILSVPLLVAIVLVIIYADNLHQQFLAQPKLQEPEEQIRNYLFLTKIMPLSADYYKELAMGYFRAELVKKEKGDYVNFFKAGEKALDLSKNNASLYLWYGQYLSWLESINKNNNSRPLSYLAKSVELNPYSIQNYFALADYLQRKNQNEDARQIIKQGLEKYSPEAIVRTVYSPELLKNDQDLIMRSQQLLRDLDKNNQ